MKKHFFTKKQSIKKCQLKKTNPTNQPFTSTNLPVPLDLLVSDQWSRNHGPLWMALWGLLVDSAKRTHKQLPRRHSSVRRSFGWKNPNLWPLGRHLGGKNPWTFVGYVFFVCCRLASGWISMNKSNPNEDVDTNSCMFHAWCQESAGLQSHFKIWPKEFILSKTRWPFRLLHGHAGDLLPTTWWNRLCAAQRCHEPQMMNMSDAEDAKVWKQFFKTVTLLGVFWRMWLFCDRGTLRLVLLDQGVWWGVEWSPTLTRGRLVWTGIIILTAWAPA